MSSVWEFGNVWLIVQFSIIFSCQCKLPKARRQTSLYSCQLAPTTVCPSWSRAILSALSFGVHKSDVVCNSFALLAWVCCSLKTVAAVGDKCFGVFYNVCALFQSIFGLKKLISHVINHFSCSKFSFHLVLAFFFEISQFFCFSFVGNHLRDRHIYL